MKKREKREKRMEVKVRLSIAALSCSKINTAAGGASGPTKSHHFFHFRCRSLPKNCTSPKLHSATNQGKSGQIKPNPGKHTSRNAIPRKSRPVRKREKRE